MGLFSKKKKEEEINDIPLKTDVKTSKELEEELTNKGFNKFFGTKAKKKPVVLKEIPLTEEEEAADADDDFDDVGGTGFKNFFKKKKKGENRTKTFDETPHLLAFKPKEKYIFRSDYFEIDGGVAVILAYFHSKGATDRFAPFWGIDRIPRGLDESITTISFEQIKRLPKSWIDAHQTRAEKLSEMNAKEQDKAGSNMSKIKAKKEQDDFMDISYALANGASYLNVHYRLMIKAPDIHTLDAAMETLTKQYKSEFSTLSAAPYVGEQRNELTNLLRSNDRKEGKGFYFTSDEFAGSYNLVTHGLEDPKGEYVGHMVGDVNTSAVLFDVNGYDHHIVISNENVHKDKKYNRSKIVDMWGSKVSQAALMDNNKVVHIIMNDCDLDLLGPKFDRITYRINMTQGDINMFEMFGSIDDELSVFAGQMEKLILMSEQAYETTDSDRAIIRGNLEKIATQFYIDRRMWTHNAKENRDMLRVLDIPHNEVPRLQDFVMYLDQAYQAAKSAAAKDEHEVHAVNVLALVFRNLLSSNGDLFNTFTTGRIDGAKDGLRVIYDFSGLMKRGTGIAMAQLVNVIAFASGNLGEGDVLIIHGTDLINDKVKDYLKVQCQKLYDKGGRVCFLYTKNEDALKDNAFSRLDKSDYAIFGNMLPNDVPAYEKVVGQAIPGDLARFITNKHDNICYIRRGFNNVVFKQNLILFPQEKRRGAY